MTVCEDYTFKYGRNYYTIGESITEEGLRFYHIHGPNLLGGGTMKENETLEEAVIARLIRENRS